MEAVAMIPPTGRNRLAPKTSSGIREKTPTCRRLATRTSDGDYSSAPESADLRLVRLRGAAVFFAAAVFFDARLALAATAPGCSDAAAFAFFDARFGFVTPPVFAARAASSATASSIVTD